MILVLRGDWSPGTCPSGWEDCWMQVDEWGGRQLPHHGRQFRGASQWSLTSLPTLPVEALRRERPMGLMLGSTVKLPTTTSHSETSPELGQMGGQAWGDSKVLRAS